MNITEHHFRSNGTTCAATLMLPEESVAPPVIIMAHGFANIRTAALPDYAKRFVDAGYAAFLFDYRTFGDSDGEPRHHVHPGKQIEDWEAAMQYVRTLPEIDSQRVVLWGTSFSGGHVLQLAARHHDLAAVISQVPHVSGPASILKAHPLSATKGTLAGLLDIAASLVNRTVYSPIAGRPGELAALTSDEALTGYTTMIPEGSRWENKVLARSLLQIPFYSPRNVASRITVPVLMIVARRDSIVSASAAQRAARKIPDCTFNVLDCDHFEPYSGEYFEQSVAMQIAFLQRRIPHQ